MKQTIIPIIKVHEIDSLKKILASIAPQKVEVLNEISSKDNGIFAVAVIKPTEASKSATEMTRIGV